MLEQFVAVSSILQCVPSNGRSRLPLGVMANTLRAKLATVRSLQRAGGVCLCMCNVRVCGSVTAITRNCVHGSSPNWVYPSPAD